MMHHSLQVETRTPAAIKREIEHEATSCSVIFQEPNIREQFQASVYSSCNLIAEGLKLNREQELAYGVVLPYKMCTGPCWCRPVVISQGLFTFFTSSVFFLLFYCLFYSVSFEYVRS